VGSDWFVAAKDFESSNQRYSGLCPHGGSLSTRRRTPKQDVEVETKIC